MAESARAVAGLWRTQGKYVEHAGSVRTRVCSHTGVVQACADHVDVRVQRALDAKQMRPALSVASMRAASHAMPSHALSRFPVHPGAAPVLPTPVDFLKMRLSACILRESCSSVAPPSTSSITLEAIGSGGQHEGVLVRRQEAHGKEGAARCGFWRR